MAASGGGKGGRGKKMNGGAGAKRSIWQRIKAFGQRVGAKVGSVFRRRTPVTA